MCCRLVPVRKGGGDRRAGWACLLAFCLFLATFLGFHAARFVSEILLRFICAEGSWVAHVWKRWKIWFSCLGVVEGNGFQGQFTFVNFMCSLFSVCICPISAGGTLPLSQMGRTDAAAEVKTDFEPMGRGGRCGEGRGHV